MEWFRQFRRREASALDQAKYLIANRGDLGEQEKRQQILMLEAKACAAVRCAEGLPSSDSHYDLLLRLQEYGDAITEMSGDIYGDLEELGVASSYRWRHGRSSGTTRLFYYSPDDVVVDVTSSNTDGAVQTVANKADAAWHTGATVVAANVAAVSGSEHMEGYRDDMIEQNIEAWEKEYQSVVGERVLNSMSAETYQDPSNYVLDFGLVVADAVPLLGIAKKSGEAVEKTAEALRNLNRAIGEGLQARHAMRRADDLGAQLAVVPDAADDLATLAIRGKYENRADIRYRTADEVNSEFTGYNPPYQPGTRVTEYTSIESDQFVRVHGEDNAARSWMMKREAIEGLSPQEIAKKYSLPEVPTKISDVNVPAGTRIRTGKVASNFDGNEGAVQYQWIGRVPESAITNTRYLQKK